MGLDGLISLDGKPPLQASSYDCVGNLNRLPHLRRLRLHHFYQSRSKFPGSFHNHDGWLQEKPYSMTWRGSNHSQADSGERLSMEGWALDLDESIA